MNYLAALANAPFPVSLGVGNGEDPNPNCSALTWMTQFIYRTTQGRLHTSSSKTSIVTADSSCCYHGNATTPGPVPRGTELIEAKVTLARMCGTPPGLIFSLVGEGSLLPSIYMC